MRPRAHHRHAARPRLKRRRLRRGLRAVAAGRAWRRASGRRRSELPRCRHAGASRKSPGGAAPRATTRLAASSRRKCERRWLPSEKRSIRRRLSRSATGPGSPSSDDSAARRSAAMLRPSPRGRANAAPRGGGGGVLPACGAVRAGAAPARRRRRAAGGDPKAGADAGAARSCCCIAALRCTRHVYRLLLRVRGGSRRSTTRRGRRSTERGKKYFARLYAVRYTLTWLYRQQRNAAQLRPPLRSLRGVIGAAS